MSRILVLLAALVAALVYAPAARGAIPEPDVAIGGTTVRPALLSGTQTALGGGPTLIYDGFGLNPPTLIAAPGAVVTITIDMAVESVTVWLGETALTVARTGERTYAATLPAELALPARLGVGLDATTATHRLTSGWVLILAAPPPDPVPTVVLGPVGEPVAAPRLSTPVRLTGRRLAVTLTCASRCAGN